MIRLSMSAAALFGGGVLVGGAIGRSRYGRMLSRQANFAIGLYAGPSPLDLHPMPGVRQPILTAADVLDVTAEFVADPFLLRHENVWHLFFEALDGHTQNGVICRASSTDLRSWTYHSVVLREPFHLSYPYVFQNGADTYMIPEAGKTYSVRLYRADPFPDRWVFQQTLLRGRLMDPSIVRYENHWWLFAAEGYDVLRLFGAPDLKGPWTEHPSSPLVDLDPARARPAGRVILEGDRLIRLAQDDEHFYGRAVRAFEIEALSPTEYREHEIDSGPITVGSGTGWNALGMHHVDAQPLEADQWIAVVDGSRRDFVIGHQGQLRLPWRRASARVRRRILGR